MTRIDDKFTRVYVNGYDLSGYASAISSLDWKFAGEPNAAFADEIMNILCGKCTIGAGDINTFLDNDTAGSFALNNTGTGTKLVTVAYGTSTVSALGEPAFSWQFEQTNYVATAGTGFTAANINVANASYSSALTYKKPWGVTLQPKATVTGVNTAVGCDDIGAASALGGMFIYHLFTSDGTVTLTAQDATTNSNGSFSNITGATSGSIDATSTPQYGMIALGITSAVRRYLRPQIAFGSASTATYFSAFIRNQIP